MSTPAPVSFTVRRPSPVSRSTSSGPDSDGPSFKVPALPRHLTNEGSRLGSPLGRGSPAPKKTQSRTFEERDSSDEGSDDGADELVTGFDQFGVQRCVFFAVLVCADGSQLTSACLRDVFRRVHEKKKPQGPLVIAPLKNRDWREVARKRRTSERFVPAAGQAATGADGSVGGLGTRDSINSGPQLIGLQKRVKREHEGDMDVDDASRPPANDDEPVKKEEPETDDQKALRALLASAKGETDEELPAIPSIPVRTLSEAEALKQDVEELPDVATLDDYERVPVSQFGAAMLRGMGWKPDAEKAKGGNAGKRPAEPWMPEQRPALLGIGAKERQVVDDGGPKKWKGGKAAQMKYMPLVKKEREGSERGASEPTGGRERERYGEQDGKDRRVSDRHGDGDRDRKERGDRNYDERDRDRGKDGREKGRDEQDRGSRRDHDRGIDDRARSRDDRRDYNGKDRRRDDRHGEGYHSRDRESTNRDRSRDRGSRRR